MAGESNRVSLYFNKEQSEGVLDTTKPFKQIRYTGSPNLGQTITSIVSEEIRADRQVSDLSNTGKQIQGAINIELSVKTHDELISGALFSNWERRNYFKASDITGIASDTITFLSTHALFEGALVLFKGDDDAEGVHKVLSVSGQDVRFEDLNQNVLSQNVELRLVGYDLAQDDVSLDINSKTFTLASALPVTLQEGEWVGFAKADRKVLFRHTETDGLVVHFDQITEVTSLNPPKDQRAKFVFGDSLKNGVLRKSYSLLQRFEDHKPVTQALFLGCSINNWNLSFEAQALVQSSFDIIGLDANFNDDVFQTESTELSKILNTGTDVPSVLVDGKVTQDPNFIQSVEVVVSNNIREQTAVGTVGAVSLAAGTCDITGTMNIYFGNKEIAERIANNDAVSYFTSFFNREDGELLTLDLPRIKFTGGVASPESKDTDVILNPEFRAIEHPDFNYQIRLQTFFAV